MMMVFGMFVFTLRTAPYQQLQQSQEWRHVKNERVNQSADGSTSGRVTTQSPSPAYFTLRLPAGIYLWRH